MLRKYAMANNNHWSETSLQNISHFKINILSYNALLHKCTMIVLLNLELFLSVLSGRRKNWLKIDSTWTENC